MPWEQDSPVKQGFKAENEWLLWDQGEIKLSQPVFVSCKAMSRQQRREFFEDQQRFVRYVQP